MNPIGFDFAATVLVSTLVDWSFNPIPQEAPLPNLLYTLPKKIDGLEDLIYATILFDRQTIEEGFAARILAQQLELVG